MEEVKNKIKNTIRKNNYKTICSSQRGMSNVDILFSEDEFINCSYNNKYKVKCQNCGNIFEDHFDGNGHPRCLVCHPNIAGFSFAEKEIFNFVKDLIPNEEIVCRDRSILKNRELDIYIPKYKLAER